MPAVRIDLDVLATPLGVAYSFLNVVLASEAKKIRTQRKKHLRYGYFLDTDIFMRPLVGKRRGIACIFR